MKSHTPWPLRRLWAFGFAVVVVLLLVAGCVISPRRIVNENPSPTPTPDVSPTPTPTVTPTPTPAATTVPQAAAQFLLLGDAASPLLTGFRINLDGSLAPLPGSPFAISAPARGLQSWHGFLVVETESGVSVYIVDPATGVPGPADTAAGRMATAELERPVTFGQQSAVLDGAGKFMYLVDASRAELQAFRVENGKLTALPAPAYAVPQGTSSVALVKP